ncbi:MAG: hypothetical protein K2W82_01035 [Candidatus Obscuribacterales bacterium]|nr:hypothetical protein [Candidatus Obscuribacterales bacterium]
MHYKHFFNQPITLRTASIPQIRQLRKRQKMTDLLQAFDRAMNRIEREKADFLAAELSLQTNDLRPWKARINTATTIGEIFAILNDFRSLSWTDQQRAEISRIYHQRIKTCQNIEGENYV